MQKFFILILFVFLNLPLNATPKQTIYVAVLQTQNYTVGAANPPSGFHRYEGDSMWTHMGWENVRNFGIAVDPTNLNYIFLACGNGAMRSVDGGHSWRITTDWRMTEVLDVSISPMNPDHIYIATAYGVWRTTDRGETWIAANDGLKPTFVQTIETDRSMNDRVIVGGEGGLYETTNGAEHWRQIGPGNVAVRDIHQCFTASNMWIAGTEEHGVLISDDEGKSWKLAKGKIANQTIYAVAIDPQNPQRMAAGGFQTGVFIGTDGGKRWTQHKKGLPVLDIHALAFDFEKPGRIWAGTLGAGVYFSDDFGKTWIYTGLKGADIWDMVIINGEN